ncbi:MAG TPA: nucleotidyltransferase domain-containing protein [Conexibacter sp.]|nr:nucleotidyltransferase domain-containing protein [Conexibacter sp.]
MDVSAPHAAICPTLDSSVLTVLAGTTKPLTGREVARLVGRRSHRGVLDVLNRLADHGLVDREQAGRALLFTLNRDHLAAPAVRVLAGMRAELLERLKSAVSQWSVAPVHCSLFGSAARGDGTTESDIDLFFVRPDRVSEDDQTWLEQRDTLARQVQRWTGNHAGIVEVSQGALASLVERQPPIVGELRRDAVVLYGAQIERLLGER